MSAWRNFYFPSSGGSYSTAAGAIRFRICYYDSSLGSTSNTNVAAKVTKISPIKMPMVLKPDQMQFDSFSLTIREAYSLFTTNSILNDSYKDDTWLIIYLDGNELWRGLVDFDAVKYSDYRYESSTYTWKQVMIPVVGALSWLKKKQKTVADYFSDGNTITEIFDAVADDLGPGLVDAYTFSAYADINYNFYYLYQLKIRNQSTTELMLDWIQKFLLTTACQLYVWDGYLRLTPRARSASAVSVGATDILSMDIMTHNIGYTKHYVKATANVLTGSPYYFTEEHGTEGRNQDFVVEDTEIFPYLYASASNSSITGTIENGMGYNSNTILPDSTKTWSAEDIEAGDVVTFEISGGGSAVTEVEEYFISPGHPLTGAIQVRDVGYILYGGYEYSVEPVYLGSSNYIRYKGYIIWESIKTAYQKLFGTSDKLWRMTLKGMKSVPYKPIRWNSGTYRIEGAEYDLYNNRQKVNLLKVV
jgi:hypothetical protein